MKQKGKLSRRSFVKITSLSALTLNSSSYSTLTAGQTEKTHPVPTARGDVTDSSRLGLTMPTELIIQETPEMSINWPDHTWGALPEDQRIADVVAKLNSAYQAGVRTIIDRTIPGIGRNIPRMQKIARQTPLNIIVTTGWYTLYELPFYFHYRVRFPERYGKNEPTLEDFMVRDIEEGILDTGVRAAAIKVVSDKYGIHETPDVRYVFRASARAHRRTGAPILTHSVGTKMARLQQEVLAEDGVDLSRVVLGHLDRTPSGVPLGEFERLLQRGSFLSFDGWEGPYVAGPEAASPQQTYDRIVSLVERGYEEQILLSGGPIAFSDSIPMYSRSSRPAYSELMDDVFPALKERGLGEDQLTRMTVDNPRRVLETLSRGGY